MLYGPIKGDFWSLVGVRDCARPPTCGRTGWRSQPGGKGSRHRRRWQQHALPHRLRRRGPPQAGERNRASLPHWLGLAIADTTPLRSGGCPTLHQLCTTIVSGHPPTLPVWGLTRGFDDVGGCPVLASRTHSPLAEHVQQIRNVDQAVGVGVAGAGGGAGIAGRVGAEPVAPQGGARQFFQLGTA